MIATRKEFHPMAAIISTFFWDKKIKIAILTLATFAALC